MLDVVCLHPARADRDARGHCEAGSRCIPESALPVVALKLSVSLMELFGEGP
jgi:hypothetical protein